MTTTATLKAVVLAAMLCLVSACSTVQPQVDKVTPQFMKEKDPFESMNRATFDFNNDFDKALFKPVAQVYSDTVPGPVQTAVGNFFGNLADIWTGFNSFLQGHFSDGFNDLMRVSINSTFGFLGVLDIASEANMPKHKTDLGVTLGVWGVPDGPYLVLPFLGPSVVRDTAALPIDFYGDAFSYVRPVYMRNSGEVLRLVDKRAGYLGSFNLMQDAALDEYAFVRDAYLQRLESLIENSKNLKKDREEEQEDAQKDAQKQADSDEAKAAQPMDPKVEPPASAAPN